MKSRLIAVALAFGLGAGGAAAQTTPVRVGFIPVLGTAPIFVADKEGWTREAGLGLSFTVFESGPNMIAALASGTIDIYVAGIAPLAVARSRGIDTKVVAATAIEEMTVVVAPKLARYFEGGARPAEALKRFRAAEGKAARFATQPPGSVPETTLRHWLEEITKSDKADFEVVPMGIDATQQAVLAGAVDGATVREPALSIIQERDPRIKLVALGGDMFLDQPGTVVAVSTGFLAKNPQAVERLVALMVRATDLIKRDPDRVAPHIGAILGKGIVEPATIRKALTSPASKFIVDPRLIVKSTAKMQAYQVKLGTLDKEYPLEGLFDPSFYIKATAK